MEISLNAYSWLNLTDLLEFQGVVFWDHTEFPKIPLSDSDQYITLTGLQADAIDLVANKIYGDPRLYWVILLANDKLYINDFIEGELIRIPSKLTIDQLFESGRPKTT